MAGGLPRLWFQYIHRASPDTLLERVGNCGGAYHAAAQPGSVYAGDDHHAHPALSAVTTPYSQASGGATWPPPIAEVRRQLGDAVWGRLFRCAFVRNPWDRLLSVYYSSGGSSAKSDKSGDSFRAFVRTLPEVLRLGHGALGHDIYMPAALRSQFEMITDENGELLVNFIARFEDLSSELDLLSWFSGVSNLSEHVSAEKGGGLIGDPPGHYSQYYDDETQQIVAECYRSDLQVIGYEYEDMSGGEVKG